MLDSCPVILIADDNPLVLTFLSEILESEYQIKAALNGLDALTFARQAPIPEIILLDVMMPGMDGYAVCEALKQDAITAAIPVIFITSSTDSDSETRALAMGAVDFLHKPINPVVMHARVRMHLEMERRATALSHVNAELARHQQHLEDLVHTRTLELAQARDAAESANRAKTAFLHNISHEMRTPLNHIVGITYLMRRKIAPDPDLDHLGIIEQSTYVLLDLVSNLLDLSRLEAQQLVLETQSFDLYKLLSQVVLNSQAAITAKKLSLVRIFDPALPTTLIGDPQRLRQILNQILGNAVKFSTQGQITLRVQAGEMYGTQQMIRLEIEDQGIGIAPEITSELFQCFRQGDNSLSRLHDGVGLGLALCKRLVTLMGGEISLVSSPEHGTTVTISVPFGINME